MLLPLSKILAQFKNVKNGFSYTGEKLTTNVSFLSPNIIHVVKYPISTEFKSLQMAIAFSSKESTAARTSYNNGLIESRCGNTTIIFDSQKNEVSVQNSGRKILGEKAESANLKPVLDDGKASFAISQSFAISKEEAIYGLGQHQNGVANMRNQNIYLQQKNMDIGIPYLQSTQNYGILWNNASATYYKDSLNTVSLSSDFGNGIDYYIILGSNQNNVMENYGLLTGKPSMLPIWSFGYIQSKERYKSPEELLEVVKKYRELKVPLDVIVQDWQYWGADNNNWNAVDFTNPKYSTVKKYIDSIHQDNAKIMISVWPSFGSQSKIYQELEKNKFLYDFYTYPVQPNVKVYDAFNPKARDIYWKYMNNNLFKLGIDAWWLDAVEPVQKNIVSGDPSKSGQELFYKDKTINTANVKTFAGSFQSMANAYPLATVEGVYLHQRETDANKRAIILTRSGFAGQQRNGAVLWSGDINGTWEVLKAQIPAAINLSYSGIPYWNSDIGGFYTNKFYPKGAKDPKYQELYVRWFQFGVFTAMLRAHGTNIAREIYRFGAPGDLSFDILHDYINLRYQLLPYIYSNSWQATKHLSPLIKGLAMNYEKDTAVYNNTTEFLFGDNILVSPITNPINPNDSMGLSLSKKQTHESYLPKGDDWFNYWTNEKANGGTTIKQEVGIEKIPLFIKAGTILPLAPVKQYSSIKNFDTLTLKVYSGKNGSFELYEDEGDNYNYEKGSFATIQLDYNATQNTLTIADRKGSYKRMNKDKIFNIQFISPSNKVVEKQIKYSGKKVTVTL